MRVCLKLCTGLAWGYRSMVRFAWYYRYLEILGLVIVVNEFFRLLALFVYSWCGSENFRVEFSGAIEVRF